MLSYLNARSGRDEKLELWEWQRNRQHAHRILSAFAKMPPVLKWWPLPDDDKLTATEEVKLSSNQFIKAFGAAFRGSN